MESGESFSGIMFADVCGSVRLYERLGDDLALKRISEALAFLTTVVTEHGGEVVKTIGDELMCSFPDAPSCARAGMQMLERLQQWPENQQDPINFRIGVHYGPIIRRGSDVFGDTVNHAARVVSLANDNQLIVTDAIVSELPGDLSRACRLIGPIYLKGKTDAVAVHELVWEESDDATVVGATKLQPWFQHHRLRVSLGDQVRFVDQDNPSITIGRALDNDFIVSSPQASRYHLVVEFRGGKFAIRDMSTNGTYVGGVVDDSSQRLHRDRLVVVGRGWFSLGHLQPDPEHRIEYAIE